MADCYYHGYSFSGTCYQCDQERPVPKYDPYCTKGWYKEYTCKCEECFIEVKQNGN